MQSRLVPLGEGALVVFVSNETGMLGRGGVRSVVRRRFRWERAGEVGLDGSGIRVCGGVRHLGGARENAKATGAYVR